MTSVPVHIGLEEVLELTRDRDPRKRKWAVRQLCPCHLKYNDDQIWDRLSAMAADDDRQVRSTVLHVLCDGSPRSREQEIVAALERMQHDPDMGLRRRVRKVLAQYRRSGTVNVL
jgi:HEAT repeats